MTTTTKNIIEIDELLDNIHKIPDNDKILSTTLTDIENINKQTINSIGLPKNKSNELLNKLDGYKLVDTIDDLEYGLYTKIIKLKNINSIDDIKVKCIGFAVNCFESYYNKNMKHIVVKFKLGNYYSNVVFDECFMFQKISDDNKLIMGIVEYLKNN